MTKKHYKAIAKAIKDSALPDDAGAEAQREQTAQLIAVTLESLNPRFDQQRFLDACK